MKSKSELLLTVLVQLLFVAATFVFISGQYDPILYPARFVCAGILIAIAVGISFHSNIKIHLGRRSLIVLIVACGMILYSIQSSTNWKEGMYGGLTLFGSYTAFMLFKALIQHNSKIIDWVAQTMLFINLVVLGWIAVQISIYGSGDLYLLRGPFIHRNICTGFLILNIPLLIHVFRLKHFYKWLSIFVVTLNLALILFLQTRSAWVAALLCLVAASLLYRKQLTAITKRFKILMIAIGATIIIVLGFYHSKVWHKIDSTLHYSTVVNNDSFVIKERLILWKKSIALIQEHPLFGVGPNNWRIDFPNYGVLASRAAGGNLIYQRPHNDYLWICSEYGIPIFLFLIIAIGRAVYRGVNGSKEHLIFILGIVAFMGIAFFSFPIERPILLLLFLFMLAICDVKPLFDSEVDIETDRKSNDLTFPVWIFVIPLGASMLLNLSRLNIEKNINRTEALKLIHLHDPFIESVAEIQSSFHNVDLLGTPLAYRRYAHLQHSLSPDSSMSLLNQAEKANPNNILVLNELANLNLKQGKKNQARSYFKRTRHISPQNEIAIIGLTRLHLQNRSPHRAYLMLRELNPNSKGSKSLDLLIQKVVQVNFQVSFSKSSSNKEIGPLIEQIINDPEWIRKVLLQSILQNCSLNNMLVREAKFMINAERSNSFM